LPAGEDLMGRYLKKGQVLAYVMPTKAPRVRVIIDQADEDLIRHQTESVQVRLPSDPGQIWEARLVRAVPGASRQLPSAAMSRQRGGEVVTDPRDESGRLALQSYFEYELALPDGFPHHLIGSRVSVRFEHPMEPLAPRVWRAARRLFLSHFQS
jgi:putative peptide zinc metalloprotease protein